MNYVAMKFLRKPLKVLKWLFVLMLVASVLTGEGVNQLSSASSPIIRDTSHIGRWRSEFGWEDGWGVIVDFREDGTGTFYNQNYGDEVLFEWIFLENGIIYNNTPSDGRERIEMWIVVDSTLYMTNWGGALFGSFQRYDGNSTGLNIVLRIILLIIAGLLVVLFLLGLLGHKILKQEEKTINNFKTRIKNGDVKAVTELFDWYNEKNKIKELTEWFSEAATQDFSAMLDILLVVMKSTQPG